MAQKISHAKESNGANLGFEAKLWKAADKLRNNMDASEYKHVVLGLVFLKYISDAFEERRSQLLSEKTRGADPEDKDEYVGSNIFWVPKESRWSVIQAVAKRPTIGKVIDDAMLAIERDNSSLKGVLPKDYARPALDKQRLGQLIDLIGTIGLVDPSNRSKDILGRVYEYFLGQFASAEGKKGGQFYTPRSIVRLLVEMIEPYRGRVFDPCCGSGGMFVQSEKFVEAHGGRIGDISVYGQESNSTTWRLCKMNLAIRGIDGNIGLQHDDSFRHDLHKDLKADYVLANPPFNDSDWNGDQLREDVRWRFGVPPASNANFAWVQHFIHHLSPQGVAGFVLANGSMDSNMSGEGSIRRGIIEEGLVDCMVALPSQLFYNTPIQACLWFIARSKENNKFRNRTEEVLLIDSQKLGLMIDSRHRDLTDSDIGRISSTYHAWRGESGKYEDIKGFCRSVKRDEIRAKAYVLTPGIYVGTDRAKETAEPFEQRTKAITSYLQTKLLRLKEIEVRLQTSLEKNGYDGITSLPYSIAPVSGIESLGEAIFNHWFADFEFPDDVGKPYKSAGGAMIYSNEMGGMIPNGWSVSPLDRIANFLNGLALQNYPSEGGDFLPVIKIRELRSGITESTDKARRDIDKQYIVENGDVIFSWSGSLEIVIWCRGLGALNQHLFKVTSREYPKWFCYYWVKHYLPEFRHIASGKATTMGHIRRHHISEKMVLVPDSRSLERMNEIMNPLIDMYIEKSIEE